ncbi:MAG: FadR/GntR family transcriptional regulator [Jatrophihabitans sp.]|uniref:FadR/GntR family transcriptional regulator n=1 Tax=Jatrophihabitans sp. TaxID=1932789 RepID=UPI003F80392C
MSLTDEAIVKIKAMILDGRLRPGDRLPREADLADQLGISRGSLREAVSALSLVRILDVRRGDGTFVTSLHPSVLMEAMAFLVDFHQDASVLELFEVRRALEPAAAEMAATAMDAAEAQRLVELAGDDSVPDTIDALVAADVEFHHRIAAASGNQVLAAMIDGIAGRTVRARVWRGVTEENARERTIREHQAIAAAIRDRQPTLARARMTVHIAGVEDWLRNAVLD